LLHYIPYSLRDACTRDSVTLQQQKLYGKAPNKKCILQ
jgi:hypothetical protein